MNELLITKYINKLTKQDIINYANYQGIQLKEKEINFIYKTIKEDYKYFLQGHHEEILHKIKQNVEENTYHKIQQLYNKYKYNL